MSKIIFLPHRSWPRPHSGAFADRWNWMKFFPNARRLICRLQEILDRSTEPWGIKISLVEVKQIDLPEEMKRAMAKQAEAERERRAKVINAEGEFQAAQKLIDAAALMETQPMSLQLRYLQTLNQIAAENNSTVVFPIPIDLFKPFLKLAEKA